MPKPAPTPTLHDEVQATLKRLQAKDAGLKGLLKKAYGYAVFPSVGKASLVVGGSYGRGEVYEKGKLIGYATIGQLTLGVQVGGDTFSEILVFDSKEPLDRFKRGKTAFAANASAVMVKAGAAGTKDVEKGVKAIAYSRGGMLLELAIGGQKFKFKPLDEEGEGGEEEEGQGQERQEQEAGAGGSGTGLAGRAMWGIRSATSMVREHPVAATVIGVGVAAGVGLLVARKLRDAASSGARQDDQDEGREDEEDRPEEEMSGDEGQDDEERDEDEAEDGSEADDDAEIRGSDADDDDEDDDREDEPDEGGRRQRSGSGGVSGGGVLRRILGGGRARA